MYMPNYGSHYYPALGFVSFSTLNLIFYLEVLYKHKNIELGISNTRADSFCVQVIMLVLAQ